MLNNNCKYKLIKLFFNCYFIYILYKFDLQTILKYLKAEKDY